MLACVGAFACGDDAVGGNADATSGSETGPSPSETGDGSGDTGVCEPGDEQACACPSAADGVQVCDPSAGDWGECDCPPPAVCGDEVCEAEGGEDCSTCPDDCGICLDCEDAPICATAAIPGVIDVHLEALDELPDEGLAPSPGPGGGLASKVAAADPGVRVVAAALDPQPQAGEHPFVPRLRAVFEAHPEQAAIVRRQLGLAGLADPLAYRSAHPEPRLPSPLALAPASAGAGRGPQSGPEACDDPKLRIRVAKIIVHEEADLVFKDNIYCAIVAESGVGAEIRVTPKTFALDTGDEFDLALAQGVVWGQAGEPVAPMGNLAMTYNCLEGDDTGAFEEFLDAIADAAADTGALPFEYGWVIPVVGLAAEIIGAALALENDDHLFNAAQIIPATLQLEMTQGVWWSVRRDGTFMLKPWDWELRLEAWGCTDDAAP